jgi:hypothetical protein
MKIRPVGAEIFHAYGRTDLQTGMTNLRVAFRNFANSPKEGYDLNYLHMENLVTTKTTNLWSSDP